MIYRILADGVLIVHLTFLLFVVFGGILLFKWPWVAFIHVPVAVWGASIEFFGWMCPLTPLEQNLRRASGAAGFSGGFIEHYLIPIIYPGALTRELQWGLGFVVVAVNLGVYVLWRRRRVGRLAGSRSSA